MKKLILTSAVLLVALMAQAQTKIAAKLTNGFKAVYTQELTVEAAGTSFNVVTEEEYAVSDVTPTGAVITVTTTKVASDAKEVPAQLMLIPMKAMEGSSVRLATDTDGKVQKVLNADEMKEKMLAMITKMIDNFMAEYTEVAQMLPKESLIEQLSNRVSEEMILESMKSGVLALNGKQLSNGATETEVKNGMKLKRMYFVMGKTVVANATIDMTKDEMKAAIIKEVEESAPDQAQMVKENIDALMGQMKMDLTEKTTYTLSDTNGWVTSIKTEANQDIMGQQTKQTSVIKLVE